MFEGKTFETKSFLAALTKSRVEASGFFGSSAHFTGLGGGSSFFL
jgi:hypothetical protein